MKNIIRIIIVTATSIFFYIGSVAWGASTYYEYSNNLQRERVQNHQSYGPEFDLSYSDYSNRTIDAAPKRLATKSGLSALKVNKLQGSSKTYHAYVNRL